ncbi:MAG: ABC transporter ATP-binding protein [Nanoarchaeota archaeon]
MEKKNEKISWKEKLDALKFAVIHTYKASPLLAFAILAVTFVGGLIGIVEPFIFKIILDKIVAGEELAAITQLSLGIGSVFVLYGLAHITQSIFWDIQTVIKRIHSQLLDKTITKFLMEKISSLDAVYFEKPEYHTTLSKASDSIWRVNEFFWQVTFLFGQVVSSVVIIGALFSFKPIVVLLVIAGAMPSLIFAFKKTNIVWSAFDFYSPIRKEAHYYKRMMTDSPEAIKEIKLFGLRKHFLEKFDSLFTSFINKQKRAALIEIGLLVFMGLIEGIFAVFAAWLVVKSFIAGEISIGSVTFFWAILFQFAGHTRWMVRMIGEINETANFVTPLVKIKEFKSEIIEKPNARPFPKNIKTGIEFRNVTFYYPGAKTPALKNISLIIKPGESVALVGENGSGKTTLVKLLCRLYDVTEGEILIDGVNIKEYAIQSLYENIGIIFQEFVKYEALISENIGYGKIEDLQDKTKVHNSALKSEAWEFIKELKGEYKTHVGRTLKEEGIELSTGQWQKIALARAFFKDAQMLILDEPTAAVDAKAEYKLFQKFEHLTKGKTTILISHRFSTVRMAHKIIVIDKGKIIEQGSHRELLRKNRQYANLFRLQAEGYL